MSKTTAKLVVNYENDRKCSICFGTITRRCLTDWCRHHFCFNCLMRWSEEHNYCPECRQVFKAILSINDLRYDNDFDVFVIENEETKQRQTLIAKSLQIKMDLRKEIDRRKAEMDRLMRTVADIQTECNQIEDNVRKLDIKWRKNNADFQQNLNQISENLRFFQTVVLNDERKAGAERQQNADNAQPPNPALNQVEACRICWIKSLLEAIVTCVVRVFRFRIKLF